jgi:hypothetical protein
MNIGTFALLQFMCAAALGWLTPAWGRSCRTVRDCSGLPGGISAWNCCNGTCFKRTQILGDCLQQTCTCPGVNCSQMLLPCPIDRACCVGVNTSTCEPVNDPNNCGGCGIVCGGATPLCCDNGAGVSACLAPDANNCGACGVVCTNGFSCVSGSCQCTDELCPDLSCDTQPGGCPNDCGPTHCAGTGLTCCPKYPNPDGTASCTELVSNEHCGACSTHCAQGQLCARNPVTNDYSCQ